MGRPYRESPFPIDLGIGRGLSTARLPPGADVPVSPGIDDVPVAGVAARTRSDSGNAGVRDVPVADVEASAGDALVASAIEDLPSEAAAAPAEGVPDGSLAACPPAPEEKRWAAKGSRRGIEGRV
jgi:hypothetical protein